MPGAAVAVAGGTVLAAAMGGVTGGATGALAGLLFGAASSHDSLVYFSQEVHRGRSLVSVTSPPDRRDDARRILLEGGALEAVPLSPEEP
jgi:hypothetical protein